MLDLRPVGYVIGLLTAALGLLMLLPMLLDLVLGDPNWAGFAEAAAVCVLSGTLVALACANRTGRGLDLRQSFVLTTGIWTILPLFGALPLMLGAPHAGATDAIFEAMSGLTTTGTTVFTGLDSLPAGTNLWRAMLQWLGGLGMVVVALLLLPVMKVGGMQFFRTEGHETLNRVLPRALPVSAALLRVYAALTLGCGLLFWGLGMSGYEATIHALATVSTGGFSNRDASFAGFSVALQGVAIAFMILATLPFLRYVQLLTGETEPIRRDGQIRAYLRWLLVAVAVVTLWRVAVSGVPLPAALQGAAFMVVSIFSGTGLTTEDALLWGPLPLAVLIVAGFVGGCTGSTGCSVKVFRYLVVIAAIRVQIRRLLLPHAVQRPRLDGRPLDAEVMRSVIVFLTLFILTYGVLVIALALVGLAPQTALTAAWTAIADIGPVWGDGVGPSGAVDGFPVAAKWLMIAGMLLGRLELLSVYVLFTARFWAR